MVLLKPPAIPTPSQLLRFRHLPAPVSTSVRLSVEAHLQFLILETVLRTYRGEAHN